MRKEIFAIGEYYHIYNRGVDKRDVFLDDRDRMRFINTAYVLNNFLEIPYRFDLQTLMPREFLKPREPLVKIVAGCLMSNHFHFFVTPLQENGISKFLHKFGVSYTMYFNKRYERSGRLFESTFKARHVDSHDYASYLTQYIHLNPMDLFQTKSGTGAVEKLENYMWSTLPDYLGKKSRFSQLLNGNFRDEVLDISKEEYRKLLKELFKYIFQTKSGTYEI